MRYLKKYWFIVVAALVFPCILIFLPDHSSKNVTQPTAKETGPDNDSLILYGKHLIDSTYKYLGPQGSVAAVSNGMNCGNCHLESGTKLFTNNFLLVSSSYPKFRQRSGRVESVEWRINECLQRSLNGKPIDTLGKEMKAMVAYIKSTGEALPKTINKDSVATKELPFLARAADPAKGKRIYLSRCVDCHNAGGGGILTIDMKGYVYPPLWGVHSYAMSAGMYRITKLSSFIKYNMPLGATYQKPGVSDEEAWDLAAYINSQPRPNKMFAYDWPVISTKPVDYPFGPYADRFSEEQHKYGPFAEIKNSKGKP